ncbi:sulfate permease (nucleomorph) [Chroomonas mesostigmatica CCMP1168]|uniref:Sulfate permease n=1 Tax=Chroomonas mesostigmatica CCMP1168 TaxID=1195612 RepID=J7G5G7_9CRYP|nr:sulfate permease [Chroomonas mesostigmatica CCMP1168]
MESLINEKEHNLEPKNLIIKKQTYFSNFFLKKNISVKIEKNNKSTLNSSKNNEYLLTDLIKVNFTKREINFIFRNWVELSFKHKFEFQKSMNKKQKFFKKNKKILLSRYELFHLFLAELIFEKKKTGSFDIQIFKKMLKIHEKLFKTGLINTTMNFQKVFRNNFLSQDDMDLKVKDQDCIIESDKSEKKSPQTVELKDHKNKKKKKASQFLNWLFYNYLPIFTWFPKYKWKKYLKNDLIAGITVGVMLIAQGMAYAKLAGLSPEYGLYSSGLPLFIYPFFGTSRHLGIGPVALVSLLVSQVTLSVNNAGHDYTQAEKTSFALLIAFSVGLTQIFMGLIKIGFIINFISHPVISGFTTAAAFVIILSQLQHILGFGAGKSHYPFHTLFSYIRNIKNFKWQPFLFGLVNIFFMQFVKYINKNYKLEIPGPIICVFASIFITQILKLNRFGISIQNKIPRGFPSIKGPIFNQFTKVAPTVLTISFINFLETIAIASKIGEMHGYKIVPNQELLGSGMTNFLGSFMSAFPMAGSFSRTAVLSQTGAKTQLAGIITGIVIILTYLFFTPLFTYLPNVTLASIILVSVVNLIDHKEAWHLLHIRFLDFFAFMISLVSTFTFGVEWGIAMAVGVSLIFVLWFSVKPPTSVLGRIPGTVVYRDVKWYSGSVKTPGGILFRMDAPLFFVNSSVLRKKVFRKEEKYREKNPISLFYIILDCRGMTDIDSTGLQVLNELEEKYNKQGVFLAFANVNERVRKLMKAGNLNSMVAPKKIFSRIHDGVETAINWKNTHLNNLKKFR